MQTLEQITALDAQERADQEAIARQWLDGIPAPPDVLRRVEERSQQAMAETQRLRGNIDVDALLREVRAES